MRLMCSCPFTLGIAKHLEGTVEGTNLTSEDMLQRESL